MRILVVEDEARLARLIARVLREEGYSPKTAEEGRSALARALSESFDLLIVDWMLPGLDGVQLVKRVRAAEMGVPVLMLTARTQVEGLEAGADDYLPKPFAFAELLARVRALLRWRRERPSEQTLGAGEIRLEPGDRGPKVNSAGKVFPNGWVRGGGYRYYWEDIEEALQESGPARRRLDWPHPTQSWFVACKPGSEAEESIDRLSNELRPPRPKWGTLRRGRNRYIRWA